MILKKHTSLLFIALVGIILSVLHHFVLLALMKESDLKTFTYSVFQLYAIFTVASMIIVGILIFIQEKFAEQIGYVFLFLTTFKMGLSYLLMLPVIQQINTPNKWEKINFFVVFVLFLTIEVINTMQLLHKSQK